jgi:hypothetical protein
VPWVEKGAMNVATPETIGAEPNKAPLLKKEMVPVVTVEVAMELADRRTDWPAVMVVGAA